MNRYKKGNITLELRVSPKRAKFILDWLYGCGSINREQYQHKLSKIDKKSAILEQQKIEKMDKILSKIAQKQPK